MKMVNSDKRGFSFKKCSAFQFVKRKVRRWIRNPKVNMEKGQSKAFLYSNPRCPVDQCLCYTQFSPYACCHFSHGYCLQDEPPCVVDKGKSCKVRKWKMLNRHHGDSKQKPPFREHEEDMHASCPWSMRVTPVMMECCVCSGPVVSYTMEEVWQPRERTQKHRLCSTRHKPFSKGSFSSPLQQNIHLTDGGADVLTSCFDARLSGTRDKSGAAKFTCSHLPVPGGEALAPKGPEALVHFGEE